jgi:hypothetical protein
MRQPEIYEVEQSCLLYWYKSSCFTGTKVLVLLVQKYLLTGTTVQMLTPEELLQQSPAASSQEIANSA